MQPGKAVAPCKAGKPVWGAPMVGQVTRPEARIVIAGTPAPPAIAVQPAKMPAVAPTATGMQWAFNRMDLNRDGVVTFKSEFQQVYNTHSLENQQRIFQTMGGDLASGRLTYPAYQAAMEQKIAAAGSAVQPMAMKVSRASAVPATSGKPRLFIKLASADDELQAKGAVAARLVKVDFSALQEEAFEVPPEATGQGVLTLRPKLQSGTLSKVVPGNEDYDEKEKCVLQVNDGTSDRVWMVARGGIIGSFSLPNGNVVNVEKKKGDRTGFDHICTEHDFSGNECGVVG
eukprot:TRINITY_DN94736_c0_g1_i1.p1 TRINITY_DN94736_c0_g1~~TRINITY_DN94736_c0_g1_i1.p1  ORF type:complete len:287 (-),score=57.10 TRINITY_DN94736_c0_g1_i1:6-866(-)